jgi:soluble epoxide hydrolase/lipid-phosphate phosphatase
MKTYLSDKVRPVHSRVFFLLTICHVDAQEFQYYIDSFKAGGMNGPLNYYRTTKHRFDEEGQHFWQCLMFGLLITGNYTVGQLPTTLPKSIPVLFLWGDDDQTCSPFLVGRLKDYVPSLRVIQVFGKGHWLMLQSPDVVASCVAEFVRSALDGTLTATLWTLRVNLRVKNWLQLSYLRYLNPVDIN